MSLELDLCSLDKINLANQPEESPGFWYRVRRGYLFPFFFISFHFFIPTCKKHTEVSCVPSFFFLF